MVFIVITDNELRASALSQAVRICSSHILPRFRTLTSVAKLTAKCNMIGRTYCAVTHWQKRTKWISMLSPV